MANVTDTTWRRFDGAVPGNPDTTWMQRLKAWYWLRRFEFCWEGHDDDGSLRASIRYKRQRLVVMANRTSWASPGFLGLEVGPVRVRSTHCYDRQVAMIFSADGVIMQARGTSPT